MNEIQKKKHTVMLDDRTHMVLTGVEDVGAFNEEAISVKTVSGTLMIRGSGLHIGRLSLETGDLTVDGTVQAMQYIGGDSSRSKLARLFR